MTKRFELRSQLRMVVNLAIEDNPGAAVRRHRLSAAADVDDGQTAMCQTDGAFSPQTFAVGAAVAQDVAHPSQPLDVHRLPGVEINDSSYAAHRFRRRRM